MVDEEQDTDADLAEFKKNSKKKKEKRNQI
jgi:hypothetical protein